MLPKIFNCAGLAFDIVGVLLLLNYGLPVQLPIKGVGWGVQHDPKDVLKFRRLGKIGLFLILTGFALQFASNLL
jgi:hypothetical protein